MEKGVCHIAQIPVRSHPASGAEMCTQLLYGESYAVIERDEEWLFIETDHDQYPGWISESSFFPYESTGQNVLTSVSEEISNSLIHGLSVNASMGSLVGKEQPIRSVTELARSFVGTPYLWGGRHVSGIDCSGLVQVVYKARGIKLPRDASQQQKVGKPVPFEDLFAGDLVFFEKKSKITHVGIYLGHGKIIHAHGYVRLDKLTKEGILNSDTGKLTHIYHSAKRVG